MENPADIPTRGCTVEELQRNELWWNGPPWLKNMEVETNENTEAKVLLVRLQETSETRVILPTCSKWRVFIRAIARILRSRNKKTGEISVEEEQLAVSRILRNCQQDWLGDEITKLNETGSVQKNSMLFNLGTEIDGDGLLRLKGRLQNVKLFSHNEVHPVLLRRNEVVDLLVDQVHRELEHAGPNFVIAELRSRGFYIIRGRKIVSGLLKKCKKCRREWVQHGLEDAPPLPELRVNFKKPFDSAGMDLAGPLYTENRKCWILLVTCMTTRAVHMEVIASSSGESTLLGIQRFISTRGKPSLILSDRGTNFIAVKKRMQIEWKLTCPKASWEGGCWERLIGLMKTILRRCISGQALSFEALTTKVKICESILNRRPVNYTY